MQRRLNRRQLTTEQQHLEKAISASLTSNEEKSINKLNNFGYNGRRKIFDLSLDKLPQSPSIQSYFDEITSESNIDRSKDKCQFDRYQWKNGKGKLIEVREMDEMDLIQTFNPSQRQLFYSIIHRTHSDEWITNVERKLSNENECDELKERLRELTEIITKLIEWMSSDGESNEIINLSESAKLLREAVSIVNSFTSNNMR
ncbi:hypothetical protein SNEBB_001236 [Seison nebaliae]|nr:hypothetical protein SNEBB_001236 [Seison nebaliae]